MLLQDVMHICLSTTDDMFSTKQIFVQHTSHFLFHT